MLKKSASGYGEEGALLPSLTEALRFEFRGVALMARAGSTTLKWKFN
jgi:hypothetical protein